MFLYYFSSDGNAITTEIHHFYCHNSGHTFVGKNKFGQIFAVAFHGLVICSWSLKRIGYWSQWSVGVLICYLLIIQVGIAWIFPPISLLLLLRLMNLHTKQICWPQKQNSQTCIKEKLHGLNKLAWIFKWQ